MDEWINEWIHERRPTDLTHSHKIVEIRMYIYFVLCFLILISNRYFHVLFYVHFFAPPWIGCVTWGKLFNLCASVFLSTKSS